MGKKTLLIKDCTEAVQAAQDLSNHASPEEMSRFMHATIDHDGQEWWIASGPNMAFDRQGFGKTIPEAVKSYFDYLRNKH